jgi:hypothetical protein
MRSALRVIALLEGLFGLLLLVMPLLLAMAGRMPKGSATWLAFALSAGPVGVFSSIQLFRLRESGRRAALAFVALVVVFAIVQLRSAPRPAVARMLSLGIAVRLVVAAGVTAILVSERARRLCGEAPIIPEAVSGDCQRVSGDGTRRPTRG